MKKERNAFFQNQSASSYFYPTSAMPVGTQNYMGAYPMATESNSNFYQGPILAPVTSQTSDYNSEIESRLAKIERQISRLDTRVTKLESETLGNTSDYVTNNMYMV
jgi:hypothetical protein